MPNIMRLTLATRRSALALTQSRAFARALEGAHGDLGIDELLVVTSGDKTQDRSLQDIGGKGLFIKELEEALLDGRAHFAVHSIKDVPAELAPGLALACVPEREDPRDALVTPHASLEALPQGALVGTGSPRRIAQLRAVRPDLRFMDLRGNLDTRLKRLDNDEYDAIVLACAGLARLGWGDRIRQRLDPDICVPAFGQGILALECLTERHDVVAILETACDPDARLAAETERELMRALGGGCKTALAALAEPTPSGVRIRGVVGDHHTGRLCRREWEGPRDRAIAQAAEMARALRLAATALGFFPG